MAKLHAILWLHTNCESSSIWPASEIISFLYAFRLHSSAVAAWKCLASTCKGCVYCATEGASWLKCCPDRSNGTILMQSFNPGQSCMCVPPLRQLPIPFLTRCYETLSHTFPTHTHALYLSHTHTTQRMVRSQWQRKRLWHHIVLL